MTNFSDLTQSLINALDAPGIVLPVSGIKFFNHSEEVPDLVRQFQPDGFAVTSCYAIKAAMQDDAVFLTKDSIGCIAAAISLGMVDKKMSSPLEGERIYTEIMRKSSGRHKDFIPPSPLEFSNGTVYACRDAGQKDYALFGEEDSGRFNSRDIAVQAISGMPTIEPPTIQGVFYFSPEFDDINIIPDVVVMSVRPVLLCRIIQGYQFLTGERVRADVGGLRAGCSDLLVRPYLFNEINFSPYCLGARLIAKFEGDRMGIGMPYSLYERAVQGVEQSKSGFPFPQYPGAMG
jgi:uncharacterized protein (DUF169 family)